MHEKVLTNEDLVSEFPEWTVDKVASKVGISRARVMKKSESLAMPGGSLSG